MWTCILLTETDQASMVLRRWSSEACTAKPHGMDIHDARTYIGTAPVRVSDRETWDVDMHQPPQSDPRWPTHCVCGYVFQETDPWQLSKDRIYTRTDTGERLTLRETEPGMMWDAPWFADEWHGPDGRCLMMTLPGRDEWVIDGPATNGPGWKRNGEPPKITTRPSIASKHYHGWLTDGVLSDDLEGRTY